AAGAASSVPAGSVGVTTAAPGASPPTSREASSSAPGAPTPPVQAGVGQQPPTTVATAATATGAGAGAATAAAAPGAKPDGKKVYEQVCSVCHGAGIAGAPKF